MFEIAHVLNYLSILKGNEKLNNEKYLKYISDDGDINIIFFNTAIPLMQFCVLWYLLISIPVIYLKVNRSVWDYYLEMAFPYVPIRCLWCLWQMEVCCYSYISYYIIHINGQMSQLFPFVYDQKNPHRLCNLQHLILAFSSVLKHLFHLFNNHHNCFSWKMPINV